MTELLLVKAGLSLASKCLDLVREAEKSLNHDDERSKARVRLLARDRLDIGVELGRMRGALGSGSGGWLLAWWSSDREKVFQLGSIAESCKKVGSGEVPDVTSPTVKLVWLSILRSLRSVEAQGLL
ncbi:hypothetical protein B296_00016403 [Ensete ventricosum]|uniref:Uncharacterized protein n=1 Tax=Ensete ventricosum TaxID=4639 RepID=A0A427AV50_ENSVE|nr:hypothetical protein B296_00016403 [Ensete ventricosum]